MQFLDETNYENLLSHEYFKMYVDESIDFKNIISKKTLNKNLNEDEQNEKKNTLFYSKVKEIEREKLFYFALVREQKTLVIKAPSENKEQTQFLGYEWSNRKGNEGIQIENEGGMLYDPKDKNSKKHIAPLIKKSFSDEAIDINEELKTYANIIETKNMLDFSRKKFNKAISLVQKEKNNIKSKYPILYLNDLADISAGNPAPKDEEMVGGTISFFRVSDLANYKYNSNLKNSKDKVNISFKDKFRMFKKGSILFPKSGQSTYKNYRCILGEDAFVTSHIAVITVSKEDKIKNRYLYELLKQVDSKNLKVSSAYPSLNISDIENIKIPVPPIDIQEKIIKECNELEQKYETTRTKIEEYQAKIQSIFKNLEVLKSDGGYKKLVEVCKEIYAGGDMPKKDFSKIKTQKYNVPIFTNGANENSLYGYTNKAKTIESAITISARVTIGFSEKREAPFYPAVRLIVAIPNNNVNIDFLKYTLKNIDIKNKVSSGSVIPQLTVPMIQGLEIYVPTLEYQEKIVNDANNIEKEIEILKAQQINLNEEINKVIEKYIN